LHFEGMSAQPPTGNTFGSERDLSGLVLDSLQHAVIVTDVDGIILLWNDAAERMYGWSADEALGRAVLDLTPSAMSRAQAQALMVQLAMGESWSGEFEVRRKDGTNFLAQVTNSPVLDPDGRLIGIVGLSTVAPHRRTEVRTPDAVQRKRVESGLRFIAEANRVLSASHHVEATLDTIAGLSVPFLADYCLIFLADAAGNFERVLGAHSDPVQEQALQQLARHRPDLRNPLSPVVRALRTQRSSLHLDLGPRFYASLVSDEAVLRAALELDGRSCMVAPLAAHGASLGVIALVRNSRSPVYDASDLAVADELARVAASALENARLFEAAERQRANAESANRSKANFVAVLSHELRTPLNAISGYVELLDMELHGPLAPEQHEHIARIKSNQRRIIALLDDVLDFAKAETGHVSFELAAVVLGDAVAEIEEAVAPQLRDKNMQLVVRPLPEGLAVLADRRRLHQVLLNLVSNAHKFSPAGSRVTLTAYETPGQVHISVTDEGPGIPAENLERMFEPFVRLAGGMKGELTVSSAVGIGSVFTLRLPRAL
jgi:PAS domain S-box-containing protein